MAGKTVAKDEGGIKGHTKKEKAEDTDVRAVEIQERGLSGNKMGVNILGLKEQQTSVGGSDVPIPSSGRETGRD